jgi:hypothetical protein
LFREVTGPVLLWAAVIAAVPPTIVGLGSFYIALENGRAVQQTAITTAARVAEVAAKADVVTEKADQIHLLVNSRLSTLIEELTQSRQETAALKATVAQLIQQATLDKEQLRRQLEQQLKDTQRPPLSRPSPPSPNHRL